MEKLSVYEFNDYKKYLTQWIDRAPNQGRGLRKKLAEAVNCQTPFVTHVLSGKYHFSLEQAEACARWIGLNDSETEFFLLLVIRQRAGTRGLEQFAAGQISERREAATVLKKRLNIKGKMNQMEQMTYYSSWQYAAVHIACMIPQLQTVQALQTYFGFPLRHISAILEFLSALGLITSENGRLKVLKPSLFLDNQSPLLGQYHSQWRLKGMEAFQRHQRSNLFFTSVISLSQSDFEWFRERLSGLLEDLVARVNKSSDEKLACVNIDWFEV